MNCLSNGSCFNKVLNSTDDKGVELSNSECLSTTTSSSSKKLSKAVKSESEADFDWFASERASEGVKTNYYIPHEVPKLSYEDAKELHLSKSGMHELYKQKK